MRLLAFLMTAATTFVPQAASTAQVSCGQVITADTKLANDLIDCPRHGIVVGANNITLDLNGHTIDGVGQQSCPDNPPCVGIDNRVGHAGLTVQDGSVQEFQIGVLIDGGRDQRVRRLVVSRNGDGIFLQLTTDSEVTGNSLDENDFGIFVGSSDGIRVARNSVSEFAEFGGCGIEVASSERVLVARNEVLASEPGTAPTGETCGICVCFGSAHIGVERNSVSGNGFVGVLVDFSDDNWVTDNYVFSNGIGVILVGDRNEISHNRVADTDAACEECGGDIGISFDGGHGNLIANNTVERTPDGPGIQFASFEPETPPAVGNIARSNVVRGGGYDGIVVEPTAADTLLDRNTTSDNGDDGIDVGSPSTTLIKNTANQNQDLGIEAVPGVTDGGGNKARGNGNPAQCTNIVCKPS